MSGARTEFSRWGWRVVLTTAGLLIIGTAFSNIMVLAVAISMLLFLLIEGTTFHHEVSMAKRYLTVETIPQTIECTVERKFEVKSIVSNHSNSNFRIIELTRSTLAQLDEQKVSLETPLLTKQGKQTIRTRFECKLPGRFEIPALKVRLASRGSVFRQSILVPDTAIVIARPAINSSKLTSIDSSYLDDLTSDKIHRGAGTDLAGIRPSIVLDDLHRIDWKATARTGKVMVKEFYLERQPPIMLLIDTSQTMKATRKGISILSELFAASSNLLASIRTGTAVGLIIYDEKSIIANVPARLGVAHKEILLQTLLSSSCSTNTSGPIIPETAEDTSTWNTAASASIRPRFPKLLKPFERTSSIDGDIPYRRRERLRRQGAFKAFTSVGNLLESYLLIAFTNGKTNLNGHVEGAKNATMSGHRVILVTLGNHQKTVTSYLFTELEDIGVKMLKCSSEVLPAIIATEIASIGRERFIPRNHEKVLGHR